MTKDIKEAMKKAYEAERSAEGYAITFAYWAVLAIVLALSEIAIVIRERP